MPLDAIAPHGWQEQTRALVDILRPGVGERDLAGGAPIEEAKALKASGLLSLNLSREFGGHGAPLSTALEAVRRIARVDASSAMLIGYHFLHLWRIRLQGPQALWRDVASETASQALLWGGAGNPGENPVSLTADADGGYTATGRKTFATGAQVADRILFNGRDAVTETNHLVFATQDTSSIQHANDWTGIGARRSASGSVAFEGTTIAAGAIVSIIPKDPRELSAYRALSEPAFQLLFAHLYLGIAEGVLSHAAEIAKSRKRPPLGSSAARAVDDPYIVETFGRVASRTAAAAALAIRARDALDAALDKGEMLDRKERDALNGLVSAVKDQSDGASLFATEKAFELSGARAAVDGSAIDRFWRDARIHTLHDAVAYRRADAGAQYLAGNEEIFLA